ncbi:diguanylate cyclase domain-containing protein [Sulfuriferula thiophila]|uniref:diguanylate cyclase domain-containing protein n=1 Tax=Sulfuriferula thiophila TaxID=1781211 RepID=UPI000F60FE27|nr:diguanylate cyclase [Sulfuriferula thiophila]
MLNIDEDVLQAALKQLKQAVYNHELWHKELTRTIIGRLPCEQRDLAHNAHHYCCLGLWFYQQAPATLRDHPDFAPLRAAHKHIHESAALLLTKLTTEATITLSDYDKFNIGLEQFRLEVKTLEREIEGILYNRDPLTGAETQHAMTTELHKLSEQVRSNIQTCSIAVMNLDHMKHLNDTYGHDIGDRALSVAVRYVVDQLRPYDRVFRLNHEKFLISMPGTDLQTSYAAIERIRHKLQTLAVAYDGPKPIFVTGSFGLALLEADASPEQTVQQADQAMYAAKSAGRNCTRIWDTTIASD